MENEETEISSLSGQLLIAMPGMPDPRFERSVLYICAHSEDGAMGLIINHALDDMTFKSLLPQLGIEPVADFKDIRVQVGGPVEQSRGFVLHSQDYVSEGSMLLNDGLALTATLDILKALAKGKGPHQRMIALGYAGWDAGQLDAELLQNGWLQAPADPDLIFDTDLSGKWGRALRQIGIDPAMLSIEAGRA